MQQIKVFLFRLFVLTLVLVILDQALGRLIGHYYFKVRSGSDYKTVYAVEQSRDSLLVMGSSRAYHHYVTSALEKGLGMEGYNLGRDGAGILYDYAVYQTICERSAPQMLLLDVNPDELDTREVTYQLLFQLLPHYDKNRYIKEIVRLRSPYERLKLCSRLYRFNSQLFYVAVNTIFSPAGADTGKGYLPLYGSLNKKPEVWDGKQPPVSKVLLQYFEALLDAAGKHNTEVVVCFSPIYRRYDSLTASQQTMLRICREKGVRVLNFSQEQLFLGHPEYFRDVLHLNNEGAQIYTRMLLQALKPQRVTGE